MQVASFVFNEFMENTYVVWDDTKECIIVDPGCYSMQEKRKLSDFISAENLIPKLLVNTHCHIDHILGNNWVAYKYNIPLLMHEDEMITYKDTGRWAAMFGMRDESIPENRIYLNHGEKLSFGNTEFDVFLTPGHSIASLSFFSPKNGIALVGDVLFNGSIGRTDLPGGNLNTLISSIKNHLFQWPDNTIIYSGHGPETTIGVEKKFNPFLS